MKIISLTILITIFIAFNGYTQVEKVEFELEKTPFKISLNTSSMVGQLYPDGFCPCQ